MSEKTTPSPRPGILDITPYVPGESKAAGSGPVIKLSANETPLGPSPKARAAYNDMNSLERYPRWPGICAAPGHR